MHRVTHRPRAVVEFAGARLGVGHHVGHSLVGAVGAHGKEEVGAEQRQQGVEILGRVVGQLLEQAGVGGQVYVVEHDKVMPVLGAALEGIDRNEAVAAGAVFHHHRLAPGFGELVGHQARHAIGAAAHREGGDDAHRLGGELLCGRPLGRQPQSGGQAHSQGSGAAIQVCESCHGMSPWCNYY